MEFFGSGQREWKPLSSQQTQSQKNTLQFWLDSFLICKELQFLWVLHLAQWSIFEHKASSKILVSLIIGISHFSITLQTVRGALLEGQFSLQWVSNLVYKKLYTPRNEGHQINAGVLFQSSEREGGTSMSRQQECRSSFTSWKPQQRVTSGSSDSLQTNLIIAGSMSQANHLLFDQTCKIHV